MESPTLTFLIATRDRRDPLLRCLRSIKSQRYSACEVVVVDDGSTDGTCEAVRSEFPNATCLVQPSHEGIGAALTRGVAHATGDVIVNLDDDCELTSDGTADDIVAALAENPGFGVVCFKVVAPDGSVRHREIPLRNKRMPTVNTEIGYFLGGAVAFRTPCLIEAGGYPEHVVYGSWENSISFRLAQTRCRILFVPGIVIRHYAIPSPQNTGDREANYSRSEIRIAATYLPAPYAQVHAALWIGQSLAEAVGRRRLKRAMTGVREGLSEWGERRADKTHRLSSQEARRLSKLSGRTWY